MNELHNDVHVAHSQRSKSKRVTFIWHQHVSSCAMHQYDPITGQTVRLDVHAGSANKRKRKTNIANY